MSLRRQANPKRDANESDIVKALEQVGAFVTPLSGQGTPDLLVLYKSKTLLLEVKIPKVGKLTPHQIEWHARALNEGIKVFVVHNPLEALTAIGAID